MKSSDLRVGNYVRIKDKDTIVIVERISRKKVGFFYNGDKSRGYFRKYSEIEGVLIYDHWQKIDCPYLEWRDVWSDGKWYKYNITSVYKTIRFIHELQNIHHALTGEELKIEL